MISRRILLGAAGGLIAEPVTAQQATPLDVLIAYERRLRERLADAGGGDFDARLAQDLLRRTNAVRAQDGAAALVWNDELAETARAHAGDLAARGYVEHLAPEGFDPGHRLGLVARTLIGSASENIAYRRAGGPATAAHLMTTWRKSPPHWTNLLRPTHAQAGFGVVVRRDRTYAVGLYARPDGVLGAPLPFRVGSESELSASIRGASPPFDSFALTDPMDEEARLPAAHGTRLAPGAYQLRPRRRRSGKPPALLWGPIFVRA